MILSSIGIGAQSLRHANATVEIVDFYIWNTSSNPIKYKGEQIRSIGSTMEIHFDINVNSSVRLKPSLWVTNAEWNKIYADRYGWQTTCFPPSAEEFTKDDIHLLEKICEFPVMTINQSGSFSFDWDGFTNVTGEKKPVRDVVTLVLENADNGELYYPYYDYNGETIRFSEVNRYGNHMSGQNAYYEFIANEKSVSANVIFAGELPAKNAGVFITESACIVADLMAETVNKGVKGIVNWAEQKYPGEILAYKEFGPVKGGGVINEFSWENIQDTKGNIWVPEFEYRPRYSYTPSGELYISGYYDSNYTCILVIEGENEAINKGFNEGLVIDGTRLIPLPKAYRNNREKNEGAPYHVETPGTLAALLGNAIDTITVLSLSGSINGYDIETIRKMKKLDILDMSRADIVSGGNPYSYYYTKNDEISDDLFADLTLSSVSLPNNAYYLHAAAFSGCYNLTTITLGIKTKIFDPYFSLPRLNEYIVPEKNDYYSTIDGVLFSKEKTTLVRYPTGRSADSYNIPNSVTMVDWHAFQGISKLSNIIIPESVTDIGIYALYCNSLNEVYCYNPIPPKLGGCCTLAGDNTATGKLYVPKGAKAAYAAADGWKEFKNIIEMPATSIDTIHKNVASIRSTPVGITVESNEGIPVFVYSLSGQKVYESNVQGNRQIRLNKGIYIVKAGETVKKVIVY